MHVRTIVVCRHNIKNIWENILDFILGSQEGILLYVIIYIVNVGSPACFI